MSGVDADGGGADEFGDEISEATQEKAKQTKMFIEQQYLSLKRAAEESSARTSMAEMLQDHGAQLMSDVIEQVVCESNQEEEEAFDPFAL